MPTITNGSVEIERQVRPADYESKKVKVALSFVIDEAEKAEHVIEHVAAMAHDHVMAALKRVESVVAGKKEPTAAVNPPSTVSSGSPASPGPSDVVSSTPAASLGAVAAAVSAPAASAASGSVTSPAPSSTPSVVTDAQVMETIQAVLNRAGADKEAVNRKVVDTIGEVAGAVGGSYRTIPADDPRRSQLIDKLNALVPVASAQAAVPAY